MRLNKFIASRTGLSRRAADAAIIAGRVQINGQSAPMGAQIASSDMVTLDGSVLTGSEPKQTILLHKPVGYVCSRNGQGSPTIYDLLPPELHHLKSVGRLDKNSSGLLLLTNDGDLAEELTHPRYQKTKVYEVDLDKPLAPSHERSIQNPGIELEDGTSRLQLRALSIEHRRWQVTMHEGRKRQIRRTFAALGYEVVALHRTQFGNYRLGDLPSGQFIFLNNKE